jgi:catechol 2,3-dioxygenase-like lactoylglutathione lyase family enzyme
MDKLIDGINHLATLTADMDRLTSFYERVFDARVLLDLEEEGVRHVAIELGPSTYLHPLEARGVEVPQDYIPMFHRGRLDHFGLNAGSEEAFQEVRRRVVAEGAGDGVVTDVGVGLMLTFIDPDGNGHEVVWLRPGAAPSDARRRADWTTVELD